MVTEFRRICSFCSFFCNIRFTILIVIHTQNWNFMRLRSKFSDFCSVFPESKKLRTVETKCSKMKGGYTKLRYIYCTATLTRLRNTCTLQQGYSKSARYSERRVTLYLSKSRAFDCRNQNKSSEGAIKSQRTPSKTTRFKPKTQGRE